MPKTKKSPDPIAFSMKKIEYNPNLIAPPPIFTDTNTDRRKQVEAVLPAVESLLLGVQSRSHVPGLAYGVVLDGQLIAAKGFGVRETASNAPVDADTVFRIASMSKSITAMAIVKLRDEGRIQLDDPVATYVPELATLPYPTTDSAPITVRHLLTMTAGFPEDNPWGDRQLDATDDQFNEWLRAGIPFSNVPGAAFEYSNYGFAILGRIIQNVSGLRPQAYTKQFILDPLQMTSSVWELSEVAPDRLAPGYRWLNNNDGGGWQPEPLLADGVFGPMGGLFSTINDWSRYMIALLDAFPARDGAETGVIRRSSLREMQRGGATRLLNANRPTPDAVLQVSTASYAFGLNAFHDSRLGYSVTHSGGLPGYSSNYRILPDYGLGLVIFGNRTYAPLSDSVTDALAIILQDSGLKPRVIQPAPVLVSARDNLKALYNDWHDSVAESLVAENFFLDTPLDNRREQVAALQSALGACQSVSDIVAENALRGRWTMYCERGVIRTALTLAPTMPPLIQDIILESAKPLANALSRTVKQLTRLINNWSDWRFRKLFAPTFKRRLIRPQLEALSQHYGSIAVGEVRAGDGETRARVRLVGTRGAIDVSLAIKTKSGKITELAFAKPSETGFVP